MADEPGTDPQPSAAPDDAGDGASKTLSQADVDRIVGERLAREREKFADYETLKEKAERLSELEEANQSELEKAQTKLTKAEQSKAEAEGKLLRFEVAAEKSIPGDYLDLLTGTTREELEAKADKLQELVKNRTNNEKTPDFDGGPREPTEDPKSPEDAHNDIAVALFGRAPN